MSMRALIQSRRYGLVAGALLALMSALAPWSVTVAGIVDWNGADGDWENGANWSSGDPPGLADDATIAGAVEVTSSDVANVAKSLANASILSVTGGELDIFSATVNEGAIAADGGRFESDSLVNEGSGNITVTGTSSDLSVLINLDNYGSVTIEQGSSADVGNLTNFELLTISSAANVATESLATDGDAETFVSDAGTVVSVLGDITHGGLLFSVSGGASIEAESITNSGMLTVDSSSVVANSMINGSGGEVDLSGATSNFTINGNINNLGLLSLHSVASANTDSILNIGMLDISGGALLTTESIDNTDDGDLHVHGLGSGLTLTDNLQSSGNVVIEMKAVLDALSISTSGSLSVMTGATINTASIANAITGSIDMGGPGTDVVLDNNFLNAGTVNLSEQATLQTGSVVNSGDIDVATKAALSTTTFINGPDGSLLISGMDTSAAASGVFENRGAVRVTDGASLSAGHYGQFAGNTLLDNASLSATVGSINIVEGALEGIGSFDGDLRVFSDADVSPGSDTTPTTTWNIDGAAILGGSLFIDIGAGGFDTLIATDEVQLDGVLDIMLLDGYSPDVGTTFDIILAASVSGDFLQEFLPVFDGRTFEVIVGSDFVRLAVTQVPIPGVGWLMPALVGLLLRRRRTAAP